MTEVVDLIADITQTSENGEVGQSPRPAKDPEPPPGFGFWRQLDFRSIGIGTAEGLLKWRPREQRGRLQSTCD
jgi:hypothetical protein